MKSYARVFTAGEPITYRYKGWIEWYSGNKEKACQAWRTACEKAHAIPMYYEEGMAALALAEHLPAERVERDVNFQKAREAFACGGLENWAKIVGLNEA
jgi:hypothetical protein